MANKVRGEIAADFEGGKINLILCANGICEIEAAEYDRCRVLEIKHGLKTGAIQERSINGLLESVSDPERAKFTDVRLLFWGMMLEAKPEASFKDASALIDGLRGKTDRIMTDAVLAAFPEADEAGEGEPGK